MWRGSLSGGKDHLKLFFRGVFPSKLCAWDGCIVILELEGRAKQKLRYEVFLYIIANIFKDLG